VRAIAECGQQPAGNPAANRLVLSRLTGRNDISGTVLKTAHMLGRMYFGVAPGIKRRLRRSETKWAFRSRRKSDSEHQDGRNKNKINGRE
jgi:hypothetical protein